MAKIVMAQTKSLTKNGALSRNSGNKPVDNPLEIQALAYRFFVERGYQHGHDNEDWLKAEAIIKNKKR